MVKQTIQILHADRELLVINKPGGLLSVPIPGSSAPNLLDILKQEYPQTPVYVVHRIDRYTSGVVLFARSKTGFTSLKEQFSGRTAQRLYTAIVQGQLEHPEGTLEHTLKQVKQGFKNILTHERDPAGTLARLHYRLIETLSKQASMVEILLETGLKNQIRVQFSAIGHPLVGDRQYGNLETHEWITRQALHASALGIMHPRTGKLLWFTAPLPNDFTALTGLLKRLKG